MKKRNEGYTLVYVLVVMVVLCLLISAVLSASMHSLYFQKQAVQSMTDKYAVQGQIEKIASQLEAMGSSGTIDLRTTQDSGVEILVNQNIIVIRASSGRIRGDCALALWAGADAGQASAPASVTDSDGDGIYNVESLAGVDRIYYKIYTAEEVAADEREPEVFVPNPDDLPTEAGAESE